MLVQLWKVLITYTKYSKVCINVDVAFNIGILGFDLRTDMHQPFIVATKLLNKHLDSQKVNCKKNNASLKTF